MHIILVVLYLTFDLLLNRLLSIWPKKCPFGFFVFRSLLDHCLTMVLRVFFISSTGRRDIRKRQIHVFSVLSSWKYEFEPIDVAAPENEKERDFVIESGKKLDDGKMMLPQIFKEDDCCGDYLDFLEAIEHEKLQLFLKQITQEEFDALQQTTVNEEAQVENDEEKVDGEEAEGEEEEGEAEKNDEDEEEEKKDDDEETEKKDDDDGNEVETENKEDEDEEKVEDDDETKDDAEDTAQGN
jgi:hypothetical protein